ncbi:MAG TPA: 5-oxoprolinase subunit PxpA [Anaerolineales bacterium]|nr:5-oxoprolinase subunit PxpA [Anaerolineales bacterium]
MKIDLNCDMGEDVGNEEEIMPYITSANIACGFHAGDEVSMRRIVRLAKKYGVAIGAHPGWNDKEGFGRREMSSSPDEVEALVLYQIGALYAIAKAEGLELRHVKPHGALYNQAAKDSVLASAIAHAVKRFNPELILIGLAGSGLVEAGVDVGLRVASEGFPDRNYNPDGTLISRRERNALLESPEEVAIHAVKIAKEGVGFSGRRVRVDTLCLHGDHPQAAQNAKLVRDVLKESGINILAL